MTQDEIINMARKAGIEVKEPSWGYSESYSFSCFEEAFERFAKLVAHHEREACAQVCEDLWGANGELRDAVEAIRARGQA
jgi:hypothetical protein